jgi:phosphopantetheine binding protein
LGLDLIEFTMAVEEAFGLSIPDADVINILTPRQLVDYLSRRLPHADRSTCRDQRAFHALRRAGVRVLRQPRAAFAPTAAWASLLPEQRRRHAWRVLHHATGTSKWPSLPAWGRHPMGQKTVGDTARFLATYRPSAWQGAGWARFDIESVIRRLMAAELAILSFEWDDEFVRDLGCG